MGSVPCNGIYPEQLYPPDPYSRHQKNESHHYLATKHENGDTEERSPHSWGVDPVGLPRLSACDFQG